MSESTGGEHPFKAHLSEGSVDQRQLIKTKYRNLLLDARAKKDPYEREKWRGMLRQLMVDPETSVPKSELIALAKELGIQLNISATEPTKISVLLDAFIPPEYTEPVVITQTEAPTDADMDPTIPEELMPGMELESDVPMLPPDVQESNPPGDADTEETPEKPLPRTRMLLEMLKEMGVNVKNDCVFVRGKNKEGSRRQDHYNAVIVIQVKKIVLVCDAADNATYIVHELTSRPQKFYRRSKETLLKANETTPGLVSKVEWDQDTTVWKNNVLSALTITTKHDELHGTLAGLTNDEIKQLIAENIGNHQIIKSETISPETETLIKTFINSHSDEVLSKRQHTATRLYADFVAQYKIPVDSTRFSEQLTLVRKERGISFGSTERYDVGVREAAKDFIQAASPEAQRDIDTLYKNFLTTNGFKEEDYGIGAFKNMVRRLIGTESTPAISATERYIDQLTIGPSIATMEADYLAFMQTQNLKPSINKFRELLRDRKRKAA